LGLAGGGLILGSQVDFDPTDTLIIIDLSSPLTISPGGTEQATIQGTIQSSTSCTGFKISIPDSSAFAVRDGSSGSLLTATTDTLILATGVSTFPMTSNWIDLKQPATQPHLCLSSNLPTRVIGGIDSLELIRMSISYPVGGDVSSIRLCDARISVLDSSGVPLDPYRLFDRIGYVNPNGYAEYQPYFNLISGHTLFTLGDEDIVIAPGDSLTITLVADIRPDVSFDHFQLHLFDEDAISIFDHSDTSRSLGTVSGFECEYDYPFHSGVAEIFLPAGRPRLNVAQLPLQTTYPGQQQFSVWRGILSYPTDIPQSNIAVESLKGSVWQRTAEGLSPMTPGDLFDHVYLTVNDIPKNSEYIGDGNEFYFSLQDEPILSRNTDFELELVCDISEHAPVGNFIIHFTDSTFLDLSDEELGTDVFAVVSGLEYPLYSAEISIAGANLSQSFRNYPNPFNPAHGEQTTIAYTLSADAHVDIEMFTITGKAVHSVASNTFRSAGSHQEDKWDGRNAKKNLVVPGTYYCRITARYTNGEVQEIKRKIAVIR
jgi:hypothetical protein